MGGCVSSNSSSAISNIIRVVHLDGWMEDYDFPVSVSEVTGSSPNYFVFTASQLMSTSFKPLKPDTLLESGLLYFVVPSSTFQAAVYPSDFASKVKKLTEKAKSSKLQAKKSPGSSTLSGRGQHSSKVCPVLISPARNPDGVPRVNDVPRCSRKKPWKPKLNTIRERSFNRRSESDLQEAHLIWRTSETSKI